MPFKDTKEGSTHFYGDGCGEPEHNPMQCKYCEKEKAGKPIIVSNYNSKEAKLLAEHWKHKNKLL
jgi:hypothetical protein